MGGIGKFLNLKGWHPSNKANQKKIWIAEQKAKQREKEEKEAAAQVQKELELYKYKQIAAASGEESIVTAIDKSALSFLYAPPPGLDKPENKTESAGAEDEAVKAFKAKISGKDSLRKLEKEAGIRPRDNLTIQEQVERFPFLKDAPVEGSFTADLKVNFKPMGVQIRNVKCLRCGQWGHQSGDRECTLKDFNPNDAARQAREDPLRLIQEAGGSLDVKQKLVLNRASLPSEMCQNVNTEAYPILMSEGDEEEEDPEKEFLSSLSRKEKKLLLKKLMKEEQGAEERDAKDEKTRKKHKKKKRKSEKKSRKKHSRHSSSSSDSSDSEEDRKRHKKSSHSSSSKRRRHSYDSS